MSQVKAGQGPAVAVPPADAVRSQSGAAEPARSAARLGWLDALRGLAALAVVFQHSGPTLDDGFFTLIQRRLDPGVFGVFLFFLISGYIVPASLERRGDLRAFWTGRLFRIYPLYLVVFVLALVLLPAAHPGVSSWVHEHPWLSVSADGLLLQDLLGVGNGLTVGWTLGYEMIFYYLVSVLFLVGWHRRSAPVAIGFATVALALGGVLPSAMLMHSAGEQQVVVATVLVLVVGALGGVLTGTRTGIRVGVLVLGLVGLVLVTLDGRAPLFESMMILATMFTGTAIQRAERGQIRRWHAVACCAFVFTAGLLAGVCYAGGTLSLVRTETGTAYWTGFVAAWLLFGLGMLCRRRRVPRALSRLGTISYAVYLVHVPVLRGVQWMLTDAHYSLHHHVGPELLCMVGFLAAVLLLAEALHRLVELPGQRLGRRVLSALPAR